MSGEMASALAIDEAYRLLMQPTRPAPESDERRTKLLAFIADARTGDPQAFDGLMQLEQDRVLCTARRLLVAADDAPDAVQEVFLRLYRSLRRYDSEQDWEAWVYRITVNVCRDLDRKRAWRRLLSLDAWREKRDDPPAPTASPFAKSLQSERRGLVLEALKRLPPKQRAAVVLRDVEGLSAAEAAAVLGSSEATVRSHASRGRSRIVEYVRLRGGLV